MMTMNIGSYGNYTNTNDTYNAYSYEGYYQNYNNTGNSDISQYSSTSSDNAHYQSSYYNCQEFKESYYIKNDRPVYQKNYEEMVHRKHCEGEGIITSDNGLSYTNLDSYQLYNNNNKRNVKTDKADDKSNWYVNEDIGQYVQCNGAEFENFNLHYIKDDFQSDVWSANHVVDGIYGQSVQHPRLNRLQNMGNNSHQNNVGKAVPTYKWMQVKRNVPKPNGELVKDFYISTCMCSL